MTERFAVFLSTNDDYFAGCCVALASFVEHNAWFQGDIIVLSDGLSDEQHYLLEHCFLNLSVVKADPVIVEKAHVLSQGVERIKTRVNIFYNFHLFTLRGYKRVLKIDADMLFRGDVRPLFNGQSALAACAALPMYNNQSRNMIDFAIVDKGRETAFPLWINAGLYAVAGNQLTDNTFNSLMEFMEPAFWRNQVTNHTDQLGINAFFNGRIELLPPTYNYLLGHEKLIRSVTNLTSSAALVWHYVGNAKPWRFGLSLANPAAALNELKCKQEWLDCYFRFAQKSIQKASLVDAHLRLKDALSDSKS